MDQFWKPWTQFSLCWHVMIHGSVLRVVPIPLMIKDLGGLALVSGMSVLLDPYDNNSCMWNDWCRVCRAVLPLKCNRIFIRNSLFLPPTSPDGQEAINVYRGLRKTSILSNECSSSFPSRRSSHIVRAIHVRFRRPSKVKPAYCISKYSS